MTSDPSLDYFEQYREKIREIKVLEEQVSNLQEQINSRRSNIKSLNTEVNGMRRIITVMIDQGMDPVEAKLRTDDDDRQDNLWRDLDLAKVTAVTGGAGGVSMASITDLTWPSTIVTAGTGYPAIATAITNTGAISTSGSMRITGALGAYGSPQSVRGANGGTGY